MAACLVLLLHWRNMFVHAFFFHLLLHRYKVREWFWSKIDKMRSLLDVFWLQTCVSSSSNPHTGWPLDLDCSCWTILIPRAAILYFMRSLPPESVADIDKVSVLLSQSIDKVYSSMLPTLVPNFCMAYLKANDTETPLLNEGRGQVGEGACSLEVQTIFRLVPINYFRLLYLKRQDHCAVNRRCSIKFAKFCF